ncbi:MAG: NADP-dependent isocitrate dehydrogenase [Lentisphaerae bacterium]|nr:NADP-dependent isocitrate dehydrogenase [Lentisphaerota bacterium]
MKNKVRVEGIVVEIDGDEMTRVMWAMVKELLLFPHLEMRTDYYDLGLPHRDATDDRVTVEAAEAIRRHGVGVKCATITPNADRVREYGLKKAWPSPNATLRGRLDGTVFRVPILVRNVRPAVRNWKRPIHLARHAYGDVYANREIAVPGPGRGELVFTPADGGPPIRETIREFDGPGILQGIHNTDASIRSFARACFTYALENRISVWFSAKDTISKTYDARFRDIFEEEYAHAWKDRFEARGLEYFFTLIDDAVARIVKSEGGMLWACKNYDGDVMSDMLASACGSLAMMTSVLVSPDGPFEYEAAHGTVQKHYYKHLAGEATSTNSMALIFAWTGGLRKRGEMDGTPEVIAFADRLEAAARETVESGIMTGDLLAVADPGPANRRVSTADFIAAVAERL